MYELSLKSSQPVILGNKIIHWLKKKKKKHSVTQYKALGGKLMNQWDSKGSDDKLCCWDPLLSSQSNDFAFG